MKYFDLKELCYSYTAEVNHIENKPGKDEIKHLNELVDNILDPFREYMKQPVWVSSGYRNEELNRLVGGSKTSAHKLGYAADIYCSCVSNTTIWTLLLKFCKETGRKYDQIFTETDGRNYWVHVGYKGNGGVQRMQSGHWIKK